MKILFLYEFFYKLFLFPYGMPITSQVRCGAFTRLKETKNNLCLEALFC